MNLATLTALVMLFSAGYAFAGAGAAAPPQLPGAPSSGRPSAVLNDQECEDAWNKAVAGPAGGPADRVLTPDKGAKIMTDFQQADTDEDGTVDKAEFQAACKNGLVQRAAQQAIAAHNLRFVPSSELSGASRTRRSALTGTRARFC